MQHEIRRTREVDQRCDSLAQDKMVKEEMKGMEIGRRKKNAPKLTSESFISI